MKFVLALTILFSSVVASAQQLPPAPATSNPAQLEIQKEAELLAAQTQNLYEKLHGLQEFQDYLADLQKMQVLSQRYQAAAAAVPSAPPAVLTPTPAQAAKK